MIFLSFLTGPNFMNSCEANNCATVQSGCNWGGRSLFLFE